MTLITTSLLLAIVLVFVYLYFSTNGEDDLERNLCEEFGLDPDEYEIVATDLGGSTEKYFLRTAQLTGVPDVVFRHRRGVQIVIGEAKSRHFRDRVKTYERYQVMLYLGVAESVYRKPTRGIIHYGCGTLVGVEFSDAEYSHLLSLIPTFRDVQRKIQSR